MRTDNGIAVQEILGVTTKRHQRFYAFRGAWLYDKGILGKRSFKQEEW